MSSTRISKTQISSGVDYMRKLANVCAFFFPSSPLTDSTGAAVLKPGGIICEMVNMDDMTLSAIDETTIQLPGKGPTVTNSGYRLDAFNMTLQGNAIATVAALLGQNLQQAGTRVYEAVYEHSAQGALLVIGYDDNDNSKMQMLMDQVYMRVTSLPGSGNDSQFTVTFYHENPIILFCQDEDEFAVEVFYDDGGSINNANITAVASVDLGLGNDSVQTATTDMDAEDIFTGRSGAGNNIISVVRDSVRLDLASMTYTAAVAGLSDGNLAFGFTTAASGQYYQIMYVFKKNKAGYTDQTETPGVRSDLWNTRAVDVNGGLFQGLSEFVNG